MFERIDLPPQGLDPYRSLLRPEQWDELLAVARDLQNLRFVHLNSTAVGGGVAEILRSLVPLMGGLGLDTQWLVFNPPAAFFKVTKKLHNLLQGQEGGLSKEELDLYFRCAQEASASLSASGVEADVWLMHDPQVLPLARHLNGSSPGQRLWVCHIDLSFPNSQTLDALLPLTADYDALIFSMSSYVPYSLNGGKIHVVPPAIDPLSVKNTPLPLAKAREIVEGLGIDVARPLISQVSRFDVWKDPWGVIDAYRVAKAEVPELQLACMGIIQAKDDPEGAQVLESVVRYAGDDPDIHLYWDPNSLSESVDRTVNAVQVASQVVIQKSVREGFGLTVTEAMWKGTPVIGGNVGGIRLQIQDGINGFLVDDANQCGQRIVQLLHDPHFRSEIGQRGHESVQQDYLLPRLLLDYLKVAQIHLRRPVASAG